MTDAHPALLDAIEAYFELMYTSDIGHFDRVFAPTAHLHGLRDGNLRVLPAAEYRKILASAPSPQSKGAPRQQEILLIDIAAPTQALAKVRVRIDTILYLDYLAFHLIDDAWRVTAKSFHVEQRFEAPAAAA
ncbi:MAG: hypothetical protein EKK41_07590 [Hyphomicrobiales bacterium]|nr:MAG: hypothetical protein EKK41_07590 [Hyphomicrobiales bacterium]